MALSIEKTTTGYNVENIRKLVDAINENVFLRAADTIEKAIPECVNSIDSIWSGQSAEAFKDKLYRDSEVILSDLKNLNSSFESQFGAIVANYDNVDASIAAAILGSDYAAFANSYSNNSSVDSLSKRFGGDREKAQKYLEKTAHHRNNMNHNDEVPVINKYVGLDDALAATTVNSALALTEGGAKLVEKVVDGGVFAATAVIATPLSFIADGWKAGEKLKNTWDKSINFIEKDYVGNVYGYLSDNAFEWSEELAFKPFKRDGGAMYSTFKSVGEIAGEMTVDFVTGGALTTATVFAASLGNSSEKNFGKLGEEYTGAQVAKMGLSAVCDASIDALKWNLTFGSAKIPDKPFTIFGKQVTDGAMKKATLAKALGTTNQLFNNTIGNLSLGTLAKIQVGAGTSVLKELSSVLVDGKFDGKKVGESIKNDALTNIVWDSTFAKPVSNYSEKLAKEKIPVNETSTPTEVQTNYNTNVEYASKVNTTNNVSTVNTVSNSSQQIVDAREKLANVANKAESNGQISKEVASEMAKQKGFKEEVGKVIGTFGKGVIKDEVKNGTYSQQVVGAFQ